MGNPREKRGRRDTHREIGSESLRSNDSDDAYNEGDDDLPPAKRRKPYEAPALIASPRFRRPPSSTSLEMDDTQPDGGCPSTFVDSERHHTLHTSRNSAAAMEQCFITRDEEVDKLAMDKPLQQEYVTDSSGNSADEDYSGDTTDDEDEDFRPVEQSKYPSPPHMRHRVVCIPTAERNVRSRHICHPLSKANEQLCSLQSSQSPSPPAESIPFAEYKEYAVNGVFKYTRIGNDATFNLELRVADLPEHFKFTGPLKAMSNTLVAKVSSRAQIPSRRPAISTHHRQRQPPKRQVQSSNQPRTTQRPITSSGVLRKKALPKRRTEWIEEEETTVVNMRKRNASWKEISVAVPSHSLGSITGHYYGTLRKRT